MIAKKVYVSFFFLLSLPAGAQKLTYSGFPSLNWPVLYSVTYESAQDDLGKFQKPVFNPGIRALENKRIVLPGYMVPFENGLKGREFMFSSLPLNACFFCGVGGPETVVLVKLREAAPYHDQPVEVRGVLKLDDASPEGVIYTLEDSEILGEIEF